MRYVVEVQRPRRGPLSPSDIHLPEIAHFPNPLIEMLKLTFAEVGLGPTLEAGPFPQISFEDNAVYGLADGRPLLARHRDHCWYVGERRFFRVDCDKAVVVQFQSSKGVSEILGPFVHFSSADGIAYGDGTEVGHIDPLNGLWFSHLHRTYWDRLVLREL
jgi:hypothetical protein